MPNQQTLTELAGLQNHTIVPGTESFKTRRAVERSRIQICGGVTQLSQTAYYAPVLAQAVANENAT